MVKKKSLKPSPGSTRASALVARLKDNAAEREVYCASDLTKNWRYVDFCNPRQGLPALSLEWFFGCRGLLAGRILRLQAKYGVGKSAFMWLMYAAGQAEACDAYCYHIETEGAPPPPDYIASYGCDPSKLAVEQPKSLEQCFEYIDEVLAEIRGGLGGSIDAKTGRKKKSKYVEPLDPKMEVPIVAGVDSFSALGLDSKVEQDVLDLRKTSALAEHSRKVAEYLRDRCDRFKNTQTLLMLASQEKAKINTGPAQFGGGTGKTSLGDTPIGFHSTYSVDMSGHKYVEDGVDIGERVTLFTTKNKLSPKHRTMDIYLVRDKGFDLIKTDTEFLLSHSSSPLKDVAKRQGGSRPGIKCEPLRNEVYTSDEEFVRAFYENEELLHMCREALRVRGFGFDFETKYVPTEEEIVDNAISPKGQSDLHGVEGSAVPISAASVTDEPEA